MHRCLSCKFNDGSWRIDKDIPRIWVSNFTSIYQRKIGSFHVCSQQLGGGYLLDVDFYRQKNCKGDILIQHRALCGCQNIPTSLTTEASHIMSVHNHGNRIAVYENEHCEPPYVYLPPGGNILTRTLTHSKLCNNEVVPRIRSFYPIGTHDCIR